MEFPDTIWTSATLSFIKMIGGMTSSRRCSKAISGVETELFPGVVEKDLRVSIRVKQDMLKIQELKQLIKALVK